MDIQSMLALPKGFEVTDIPIIEKILTIFLVSTQLHPCCPLCASQASHIHSRYRRHVLDLPCAGQEVHFVLLVRKFFCKRSTCTRLIFVERLTPFLEPWARVTTRLFQSVQAIGLATGGMLGARLADRLGMVASWMTVLRRIMVLPDIPVEQVIELGIDDFAFRRGRKYGTILVDMVSHKVIDLLPDRTSATSAAWMASHPEIEVVSRDRGGDYASAARESAPQAIQSTDRFHLLKNLGEMLEGVLAHHLAAHRTSQTEKLSSTSLEEVHAIQPAKLSPKEEQQSQAKREERLAQYQHVMALHKIGFSQPAIAKQVGIGHATVSRWLESGTFPEQPPRPRKTGLDPYLPFLRERWEAGCHNIAELYRELVARGYTHSYESVYEQLVRLLPEGRKNAQPPSAPSCARATGCLPFSSSSY